MNLPPIRAHVPMVPRHRLLDRPVRETVPGPAYILTPSRAQALSNSSLVHLKSRRHRASHSPRVGFTPRLAPRSGTGTVGPGRGEV
jgi:hypothetical protein